MKAPRRSDKTPNEMISEISAASPTWEKCGKCGGPHPSGACASAWSAAVPAPITAEGEPGPTWVKCAICKQRHPAGACMGQSRGSELSSG
jgi:hypothetical protein